MPITVVVTGSSVTFCRHDGESHRIPAADFQPYLETIFMAALQPPEQTTTPPPTSTPAPAPEPVLTSPPQPSSPVRIPDSTLDLLNNMPFDPDWEIGPCPPSPPARSRAPSVVSSVRSRREEGQSFLTVGEVIHDLNNAPVARVPTMTLPTTNRDALVYLLNQIEWVRHRTNAPPSRLLHLAYELGHIRSIAPQAFYSVLRQRFSRNTTDLLTMDARRTYDIGRRVGLGRLLGTTRTTLEILCGFTDTEFTNRLLPGLNRLGSPPQIIDLDSEDLVS